MISRSSLLAVAAALTGAASAHAATIPVALVEAETMQLPTGASLFDELDAFGGRAVKMRAGGTLRTTVTLPRRADFVQIRVRSVGCNRSQPSVGIQTEAKTLMKSTRVASSPWTTRSGHGFGLAVGTHTITIQTRAPRADGCVPELHLDRLALFGRTTSRAAVPTGSSPYQTLVFADEFGGAAGTQPDSTRWTMKNGKPWNEGLNSYTTRTANVAMDGKGALDLIALKETYTGADGVTRDYTSGAVESSDKYRFTYGHIEAKIWAPAGGRGFWSSFWTLRWPIGGEVDIFEHRSQNASTLHTNIRGKTSDGYNYYRGGDYQAPSSLGTGYHVYGMTWEPDRISWQYDGTQVRTVARSELASNQVWGFNEPEWIILNLGVGGNWSLSPNSNTVFPSRMKIAYVRVFQ